MLSQIHLPYNNKQNMYHRINIFQKLIEFTNNYKILFNTK